MTRDQKKNERTPLQKLADILRFVCLILGLLSFILINVFTIYHLGFNMEHIHHSKPMRTLFTLKQLWVANALIGILAGAMINPARLFVSALAGLFAALGITGFGFLYYHWRESVEMIETVIVLGIGILPGVFTYSFLSKMKK